MSYEVCYLSAYDTDTLRKKLNIRLTHEIIAHVHYHTNALCTQMKRFRHCMQLLCCLQVEAHCYSSAPGAAFLSPAKMLEAWLNALLNFS